MDVSPHMQPKRLALTQGEAGKLDPDGDGHPNNRLSWCLKSFKYVNERYQIQMQGNNLFKAFDLVDEGFS